MMIVICFGSFNVTDNVHLVLAWPLRTVAQTESSLLNGKAGGRPAVWINIAFESVTGRALPRSPVVMQTNW